MRLLFVIPHYFRGHEATATNRSHQPAAQEERLRALMATVGSLRRSFAGGQGLDHFGAVAWTSAVPENTVDIVICTTGRSHLLDAAIQLRPFYRHHSTEADPMMLGFECHRLLGDAQGRYDYYGYVEDDIVLSDPSFFRKRRLFDRTHGAEALLQPNRYEAASFGAFQKLYVDYRLNPRVTAPFQQVSGRPRLTLSYLDDVIAFERTTYPSAGCFFLNAEQLRAWAREPHFLDGDVSYLSALDSAATLSVMKTFRIYKPVLENAWFLEVQHASPRWLATASAQARIAALGRGPRAQAESGT